MDKERVKKWLNDAIVISHELRGIKPSCGGCTVTLPEDIVDELFKEGIVHDFDRGSPLAFAVNFDGIFVSARIRASQKEDLYTSINIRFR